MQNTLFDLSVLHESFLIINEKQIGDNDSPCLKQIEKGTCDVQRVI